MHYYVREYIEGITLDELVRIRGVLPPKEAVVVVAEICSMVNRLHCAKPPIVCCDIKPENIIACPDGKYRIIDLDTARYMKEDVKLLGMQENAAPSFIPAADTPMPKHCDVRCLGRAQPK